MNNLSFDSSKFFLGGLCKNRHNWNGTDKTLRLITSRRCPLCLKEAGSRHRGKKKSQNPPQEILDLSSKFGFDPFKFKLGDLTCEHNYKDSGYSLRRQCNSSCVFCESENKKRDRAANPEKFSIRSKQYYETNKEKVLSTQKVRKLRNHNNYRERSKLYARRYRSKPDYKQKIAEQRELRRQEFRQRQHVYRASNSGRVVTAKINHKRRAKKLGVHFADYSSQEAMQRLAAFENRCAYCGEANQITLDHFIPLTKGGAECLGNIIPCCQWCNSSKCNKDPWEWYKEQVFYKYSRWKKILSVLGKKQESYNQIPLL